MAKAKILIIFAFAARQKLVLSRTRIMLAILGKGVKLREEGKNQYFPSFCVSVLIVNS